MAQTHHKKTQNTRSSVKHGSGARDDQSQRARQDAEGVSQGQAEQQAGAEQDYQVLQGTGRDVLGAGELRIEEVSWRVDQRQGFREF